MKSPSPSDNSNPLPSVNPDQRIPSEPVIDATIVAPSNHGIASTQQDPNLRWWSPFIVAVVSLPFYVLISLGALCAVVIATVGVGGLSSPSNFTSVGDSRAGFLFIVVIPQVFLIVPAMGAAILSPVPLRERLKLVRGSWPVWAWVAAAVGTPLVGMISGALVGLFMEESENLKEMSGIFRELGTGAFAFVIAFVIGITPAICEEILFRGYIQSRLTKALPAGVGIVVAALLFAVFHMDPVHIIAVFPMGLYLGWICYRSGSLIPAMMGHFVNNFFSVLLVVFGPEEEPEVLAIPAAMTALLIFGIGAAGLLLTLYASVAFPLPPSTSATTPDAALTVGMQAGNYTAHGVSTEESELT